MADEDDPIAVSMRRAGWCQGDLVDPEAASSLLKDTTDHCAVTAASTLWPIILTQDCDLLREHKLEPFVELLAVQEIEKPNPQRQHSQSARWLHIPFRQGGTTRWSVEASIHDRFRVAKKSFVATHRQHEAHLSEDAKREVRQWVARRYTRRPFPDAFEQRVSTRRDPVCSLFKRTDAKLITTIYIATTSQEISEGTDYEIDVLLTARGHHIANVELSEKIDDFEERFREVFEGRDGIRFATDERGEPRLRVINEDDVTLGMLRRYKRFDADYRSSGDDAESPPELIDEEAR